jgi:hypothetical protein
MRAELPAVAPALHLVASGRWRATLDAWPSWWRSRWSALVAGNEAQGLAHETAEQLAFLEAAELPDDAGEASAEQLAHEPPAGWRSELEHWPEWRREAWEELSARIEYVDGQPREPAERLAYLATAALPEPPAAGEPLDAHDQERAEQLAGEASELQPPGARGLPARRAATRARRGAPCAGAGRVRALPRRAPAPRDPL